MEDVDSPEDRGQHGTEGLDHWMVLPEKVRSSILSQAKDREYEGATIGAIVAEAVQTALVG